MAQDTLLGFPAHTLPYRRGGFITLSTVSPRRETAGETMEIYDMNEHTFFEWKRSERLTAALVLGLSAVEVWVIRAGHRDESAQPADAVIVLGAGVNGTTPSVALQTRIDAAEAYLKANPGIPAVLSGGRGPGENLSEAQAMFNALTARGIDPARLILEEQSANTRQNLQNSLPLLEERGFDSCGGRVAIVTNDFHMARVTLLWNLPAKVVQVPARLPWRWLSANYYLRESFAVVNDLVIRPLLA